MQSLLPLVGLAIFLVVALRAVAARCDRGRIEGYVAKLGGHVLDLRWFPAGPESFGDESACIYAVRYLDSEGNEHAAHCQTSIWTRSVRFVEDRIVRCADPPIVDAAKENGPRARVGSPLKTFELARQPR